jgi:hypothetical protein
MIVGGVERYLYFKALAAEEGGEEEEEGGKEDAMAVAGGCLTHQSRPCR